jgi:uncharacterized protein (TIGR02246 family)
MTRMTSAVLALCLMAAPALAQKGGAKDEEAIKAAVTGLVDGWNKHDGKAMAAVFADDAVLINPAGRTAKGKAEIEKLLTDEHTGMMKDVTMAMTIASTRMLKPDVAFLDVDADATGMKTPDGKPLPGKHHVVAVAAKKAGKWWLQDLRAYAYVTPPPPPAQKTAGAPAPAPTKK